MIERGNVVSSRTERSEAGDGLIKFTAARFAEAALKGTVIGGLARNHWEQPRLTYDLDLTVAADKPGLDLVVEGFVAHGYEVLRSQGPDQPSGPDFVQLYHPELHYVVEFQAAKTEFQSLVIERGVPIPGAEPLTVASREDLVVMKLIAFRSKDQIDLHELASHAEIDWAYIEHWAAVWGVEDRLEQLRAWLQE
jgi:hypothetical protein